HLIACHARRTRIHRMTLCCDSRRKRLDVDCTHLRVKSTCRSRRLQLAVAVCARTTSHFEWRPDLKRTYWSLALRICAVAAILLGFAALRISSAYAQDDQKVTICRSTGSSTNPYVQMT